MTTIEGVIRTIDQNYAAVWTFLLLTVRFQALMTLLPGIGEGPRGIAIRIPAVMVLAAAAMASSPHAPIPPDWGVIIIALVSEFLLGSLIGMIPLMIISAVQTAGHLSSQTMGLGASQLIDPTLGISVTDLARIYSDLTVLFFLLLGGHHVLIYAAAGFGGTVVPGTFVWTGTTLQFLIDQSAAIFELGFIIAAPVIVALLLTQFVMGLLARAVPTLNLFIISFPLTIGIGLTLSILGLPEVMNVVKRELTSMESGTELLRRATTQTDPSTPSPTPSPF